MHILILCMLVRNYTNSFSKHAFICLQLKLKITVSSLKGTTLNGICCIIELLSNVSLYNLGPFASYIVYMISEVSIYYRNLRIYLRSSNYGQRLCLFLRVKRRNINTFPDPKVFQIKLLYWQYNISS